jgi:hypothetical protein
MLAIYRGGAKTPGLIAAVARVQGEKWTTESSQAIWQGAASRMLGTGNFSDELSGLKLGSPSVKRCADGTVLVAFWCQEEGLGCIRWFRLKIDL